MYVERKFKTESKAILTTLGPELSQWCQYGTEALYLNQRNFKKPTKFDEIIIFIPLKDGIERKREERTRERGEERKKKDKTVRPDDYENVQTHSQNLPSGSKGCLRGSHSFSSRQNDL